MQVELIELELGVVQNIGDYSNVRPTMKMVVKLDESDDLAEAMQNLQHIVVTTVHTMVDDELEQANRPVKYFQGPLYRVKKSDIRQCIVVAPVHMTLPNESNWAMVDSWSGNYDKPPEMRLELAMRVAAAMALENEQYVIVNCVDGNLVKIPVLPDPGPQPLWSQKDIDWWLKNWHVDESEWETIASLDWVSRDYLQKVHGFSWDDKDRLSIVRENRPMVAADVDEVDEDDDDVDF